MQNSQRASQSCIWPVFIFFLVIITMLRNRVFWYFIILHFLFIYFPYTSPSWSDDTTLEKLALKGRATKLRQEERYFVVSSTFPLAKQSARQVYTCLSQFTPGLESATKCISGFFGVACASTDCSMTRPTKEPQPPHSFGRLIQITAQYSCCKQ